jgi:MATE family multidrug resistance protein
VGFGFPTGLNYFMEFAAFQVFLNVVLAGLGNEAVAAMNVVIAINSIAFMPAFGLASAGAILAGQAIGNNARHRVWPVVKLTMSATMIWMVAIALLYCIAPRRLLGLFAGMDAAASAHFITLGATMLVISAANQVFDAIGMTLAETLRAAGDTTWPMTARLLIAWTVFVPGGYAIVNILGYGAVGAMFALVVYIALVAVALVYRFRGGAWKTIELIEPKLV